MTELHVTGDDATAAILRAKGAAVAARTRMVVRHFGTLLTTRIQSNASGRPGPNAPTGDYRRSWGTTFSEDATGSSSTSGTNKPQGRRLEYGFVGADSLGRVYNQPPYPHVGPARDWVEPLFVAALREVVE